MDEINPSVDDILLERLTANDKDATVLGLIPASCEKVESEWRQMKHLKVTQKIKTLLIITAYPERLFNVD